MHLINKWLLPLLAFIKLSLNQLKRTRDDIFIALAVTFCFFLGGIESIIVFITSDVCVF